MKKDLKKTMSNDEYVVRHYLTNQIKKILNPGFEQTQDINENKTKVKVVALKLDKDYYEKFNEILNLNYWFSISELMRYMVTSYISTLNKDSYFESTFDYIQRGSKRNPICSKFPIELLNKIDEIAHIRNITRTLLVENAIFWFHQNWSLEE